MAKELVTVAPYLQNHLLVANGLQERFCDAPVEDVGLVQDRIHDLVSLVATRDATIETLLHRLHLVRRAALDKIDGDSPKDTAWSEIVGIANGDPHWLQHARTNYAANHYKLVTLARSLFETFLDSEDSPKGRELAVQQIADQIEQDVLPELMLGEDGRTFRKSQGKPLRDPRR